MGRQTQVLPSVMSVTLTALSYLQLSYIPCYGFRQFDLVVLKILTSTEFYEGELKIKNNSFMDCHSKGLVMKVICCDYFNICH